MSFSIAGETCPAPMLMVRSSPGGSIVANVGRCYNSSTWTYYSIDTCIRQQDDSPSPSSSSVPETAQSSSLISGSAQSSSSISSSSPSAAKSSATAQSSDAEASASSSGTNTGAIAGGVVGGIAGLAIIVGGLWFFLRRRGRQHNKGAGTRGPVEVGGEPTVEMPAKEVSKPSELPDAYAEAYAEPPIQELSAEGERGVATVREAKGTL